MTLMEVRKNRDRLVVMSEGCLRLLQVFQQNSAVVVRLGEIGFEFQGLAVTRECRVTLA